MLSDCLTKSMDSEILRECLRSGVYSLRDEEHVLKERLDKRQRVNWVKNQAKMVDSPTHEDLESINKVEEAKCSESD